MTPGSLSITGTSSPPCVSAFIGKAVGDKYLVEFVSSE